MAAVRNICKKSLENYKVDEKFSIIFHNRYVFMQFSIRSSKIIANIFYRSPKVGKLWTKKKQKFQFAPFSPNGTTHGKCGRCRCSCLHLHSFHDALLWPLVLRINFTKWISTPFRGHRAHLSRPKMLIWFPTRWVEFWVGGTPQCVSIVAATSVGFRIMAMSKAKTGVSNLFNGSHFAPCFAPLAKSTP